MNFRYLSKLTLTMLVMMLSPKVLAASDYHTIIQATRGIIAGRVFENEEGTRIAFTTLKMLTLKRAEMGITISYTDGVVENYNEAIINDGPQIRVEQSVGNRVTGSFLISVESPFHVLRIRPVEPENTNFISRECVYQASYALNVCYLKMKSENNVLVSVFREIRNL